MTNLVAKASQLIHCRVDEAFDAFVQPAKITQFWLASTSAALAHNAKVTWHFMVPGAVETVVVDAFEAGQLIAFTWSDGSQVRLQFSAYSPAQTQISVEVRGFAGSDAVEQVVNATEGFSIVLCDLKTFLESGRSANLVRAKAELIAGTSVASSAASECQQR
jgi:uncharacterized protein YndB with AHSA1/START domain